MKIVKFGGSSLASAESILQAKNIVNADPLRTFVVVSAPGKCKDFNRKITDLLIDAHAELGLQENSASLDIVIRRFRELARELEIDIETEISRTLEEIIINQKNYDFVVSRGEYLMAILFAKLVGFKFIDAANYVVIGNTGKVFLTATQNKFLRCVSKGEKIVMGGFYGSSVDGGVKTFTRGGSDYSGAIAAVCLKAELYENFTDTYGVQSANPSIVKHTKTVAELDFNTMHKLSLAGASVIYPNCLPLLKKHGTPLKIDNTFDAGKSFTRVDVHCNNHKYFCITYKFEQNISKDTVEILCVHNKIGLNLLDLRTLFKDAEVYLVKFEKKYFTLIAPEANLKMIINTLHKYLIAL